MPDIPTLDVGAATRVLDVERTVALLLEFARTMESDAVAVESDDDTYALRQSARVFRLLAASLGSLVDDAACMDWLERKSVNVRQPLAYGSSDLFWASPIAEDADTVYRPSPIRQKIRAALRSARAARETPNAKE